ncbi:MAG: hypothetical protein A3B10_03710 [Candidatus Doudnabacteria bacterium RIFCSPLOWO2_01_FULL_44_21]|uniref:Uncharacterized protein n=1 Tax=Candidatus Doudnabacteria bacterium RIFCSPLOWO2_01_FULL_44_21 TaxID=1817841 RepID=A0A1F5PYJ1_9BACT|nr:MAG: hypothetical protein A3B95_02135 [Candidatus Doudnabacteria bacterium RIFCSPHIGHO2_02_FULL_43_13b]OGE94917.1 MAG: hypothetical protein A3B10_03710 [Candidatus Doudnabacteria bacterium RIFCSPLOWO2_01_FULL_44_21]
MKIIEQSISLAELQDLAKESFGDMVKVVIDLEKKIMAMDAELHADEEALLLDKGSKQENLWGFNIYVNEPRESWLEFNSMVNIRPSQNNPSRNIQSQEIKDKITLIVNQKVK